MIKISYLNSSSENTALNLFKRSVSDNENHKYVLDSNNYSIEFLADSILISEESTKNTKKRSIKNFFDKGSKDIESSKYMILFDKVNDSSLQLVSNKIIYLGIYPNINFEISSISNILLGEFKVNNNNNLNDLQLNLTNAKGFKIDEYGNLYLNLLNCTFIIKAPVFNGITYKFTLENNFALLNLSETLPDISPLSIEDNSNDYEADIHSEPQVPMVELITNSLNTFSQPIYPIGERKLLIKVAKSKLNYLYSAADNIMCCPNLGIINDLYINDELKYKEIPIGVNCTPTSSSTVNAKVPYRDITYTPYISYSVSLYNYDNSVTLPNIPITTCIDGLYIYALENDAFVGDDVILCSGFNDTPLKPVDFNVVLDATCQLLPDTTLDDYFVYLVTINIGITQAPPINDEVNQDTLEDLNVALGREPDSTKPITKGELETITILNLSNSGESGLSVLTYTPNLESLTIDSAGVTDITPLQSTPNLQELYLAGNNISDLGPLKYLPSLNILDISSNQINSLAPLQDLSSLEELIVQHNSISDLLALENVTSLRVLNILDNNITSLEGLENLTSLNYLNASLNSISSLDPISNLTQLTTLILSQDTTSTFAFSSFSASDKISDISVLENLTELVTLDLSGNAITDIYPLASLTKLENIDISNQIIILETPIEPELDGDYELSTEFLVDIDGLLPTILTISDDGYCLNPDSALCSLIIWPSSSKGKTVSFTFTSDLVLFNGTVSVTLLNTID